MIYYTFISRLLNVGELLLHLGHDVGLFGDKHEQKVQCKGMRMQLKNASGSIHEQKLYAHEN